MKAANCKVPDKRMQFDYSRSGKEAKMVLIEAVKGSGVWLKIDPPLYIYEKGNKYSSELRDILGR